MTEPIKGVHELRNFSPKLSNGIPKGLTDLGFGKSPFPPSQKIEASCRDLNGDKWEFYRDHLRDWRWRRTATNGRIVGASTEGYINRSDCESNARRMGMVFTPR